MSEQIRADGTMTATTATAISSLAPFELTSNYSEPRWYAAYTCANHEKRVAEQLDLRGIEGFLPLYESVRRWKDRRVRLSMPLFPSYVFVRIPLRERLRVLNLPGVVRFVAFSGTPTPLPDDEFEALRKGLSGSVRAEPYPFTTAGRRVRIRSGPLAGLSGVVLRRKGRFRLVLSIESIQRSIIADVDAAAVTEVSDLIRPFVSFSRISSGT